MLKFINVYTKLYSINDKIISWMNFHFIRLCTVSTFPVHLLSPTSGMLLRRVTSAGGIYLSTKTFYKFVRVEKESAYCIALGGFMWGILSTVDMQGRYLCHGSTPCAPITLTEVYLSKSITVDGQLKESV